jgi:hypothetical protein
MSLRLLIYLTLAWLAGLYLGSTVHLGGLAALTWVIGLLARMNSPFTTAGDRKKRAG